MVEEFTLCKTVLTRILRVNTMFSQTFYIKYFTQQSLKLCELGKYIMRKCTYLLSFRLWAKRRLYWFYNKLYVIYLFIYLFVCIYEHDFG